MDWAQERSLCFRRPGYPTRSDLAFSGRNPPQVDNGVGSSFLSQESDRFIDRRAGTGLCSGSATIHCLVVNPIRLVIASIVSLRADWALYSLASSGCFLQSTRADNSSWIVARTYCRVSAGTECQGIQRADLASVPWRERKGSICRVTRAGKAWPMQPWRYGAASI